VSAIFSPKPLLKSTQITTIKDAMNLPAFNALYAVEGGDFSANNCTDKNLGTSWMKAVIHDAIRSGGKNIDYNFFFSLFGFTPISVDTTRIFNRYLTDLDHNIYVANHAKSAGAGASFTATVLRENHTGNGKNSYAAKGFTLVDKENNIWYSVEDVDTSVDYAHKMTLIPWDGTIVGELKANTKYLVLEPRAVSGNSTPLDTTSAIATGWAQEVNPIRVRKDWGVNVNMKRGYQDKIRFTLLWDKMGKQVEAWDAYEAQNCRDVINEFLNVYCFIGTPITNALLIDAAATVKIDAAHKGFYGLLPTLQYGGGNVIDFDPTEGFDLDGDLEPFILVQDTLKQTSRFLIRHGNAFQMGLDRRANRMVKYEGLGLCDWMAFQKNGGTLTKLQTTGYSYAGYVWDFSLWGALNDTRWIGTKKFDNMGIGLSLDGIVDAHTNQPINAMEFYQYGAQETSGFEEYVSDRREIDRTERLEGWAAQALMMAVHCPHKHLLFNPVQ
jgi:hypothetical protein